MLSVGQKFIGKKPHACGGGEFEIVRVGADYKIKCLKCGRHILMDYDKLQKAIKKMEE